MLFFVRGCLCGIIIGQSSIYIDQPKQCKIKSKTSLKISILHTHQVWWHQNEFHITIAAPTYPNHSHATQLLQERPPWNLSRSKRPGRWRRDAKHLNQVEIWMVFRQVRSLGMNISSEMSTGWIRHFGGASNSWSFRVRDFFLDHWFYLSLYKLSYNFYVHNHSPSLFWRP